MRAIYLVLPLLALAGCAKPMEVSSITEIKPQSGKGGLDVYADKRAAGQQVPQFAGDQIVQVRTYMEGDANNLSQEIPGAACKLSATEYSADIVTPAKVRVPIYRAQSSTLAVKCEKEGFLPKMQEAAVENETQNKRLEMGSNGGLIGVALALAVNGVSDTANDDFKYPVVKVVMAPKTPAVRAAVAPNSDVPPH